MILIDRPRVVTDTETTGLSAANNRIMEIAATRLHDGEEPLSFSELIDPGQPISYRITRLTGITTAMVFGRPGAADVIPEYESFLGDAIIVAHNLSFDRGFINAERARIGLDPMKNAGLCTVRLARRLLPGLRSKSLAALARFFRIPDHGRHRALRDVEITVAVLERLMIIAAEKHNVTELDELLEMQSRTYARINPYAKHIVYLRGDVLPKVPDEPGVYRMLDGRKRVLYVGKAKLLSRRVRSYFNAIEAHPPRIRQLIAKVRDISWTETKTELEALLLESRQIREFDPPFNRAQKRTTRRPYIRIGKDSPFPRITSHVFPRDDGALYFGPFRSRGQARSIVDVIERFFKIATCDEREFARGQRCMRAEIGRCGAPCEKLVSREAYSEEIERIISFLQGDVAEVQDRLREDMESAAASLAFEDAARLRDLHVLIEGLLERHGRIAPEIFGDDAIILHRAADEETVTAIAIRSGLFQGSLLISGSDTESTSNDVQVFVRNVFDPDLSVLDPIGDADQIRVLMHWLSAHRDEIERLDYNEFESNASLVDAIVSLSAIHCVQ